MRRRRALAAKYGTLSFLLLLSLSLSYSLTHYYYSLLSLSLSHFYSLLLLSTERGISGYELVKVESAADLDPQLASAPGLPIMLGTEG